MRCLLAISSLFLLLLLHLFLYLVLLRLLVYSFSIYSILFLSGLLSCALSPTMLGAGSACGRRLNGCVGPAREIHGLVRKSLLVCVDVELEL